MPPKPEPVGLRIELEHVKPLVWRRIVVSNQWTLASLHNYVQWVVGWQDSHAHEFHVGSRVIAPEWHFLACVTDSNSEEHIDTRRWVGGVFDPAGFDLNRVNRDWSRTRRRRR